MARKRSTTPPAEAVEEPVEETDEAPAEDRKPTLADRYIGINGLIVQERARTRLTEATLVKSFEVALQFHAWQTQMDAQEAQQNFNPAAMFADQQAPPDPDEFIGPAEDNVVDVNFTPAEETE